MSKTTITLYRAPDGWRWQMTDARNGRIIGASTEGYSERAAMLKNLARVTGCALVVKGRKARYERTVDLRAAQWFYV